MQYNTMKKAEIITMLNDKDAKIAELVATIDGLETEGITLRRENERLMIQNEALMNALKAVGNTANAADKIDKNVDDIKLNAPTPDVDDTDNTDVDDADDTDIKRTRQDGINDWLIKKYGSLDNANAVKAMTSVVAKEWSDKARATGKRIVSRHNYKAKLYAESYLRILVKNKADKKLIAAQKKIVDGLK